MDAMFRESVYLDSRSARARNSRFSARVSREKYSHCPPPILTGFCRMVEGGNIERRYSTIVKIKMKLKLCTM